MSKENESTKELFGDSVSDVLARLLDESEELHLRREIERIVNEIPKGVIKGVNVRYSKGKGGKGKYVITLIKKCKYSDEEYFNYPCKSLQQCHDKLREISGEK